MRCSSRVKQVATLQSLVLAYPYATLKNSCERLIHVLKYMHDSHLINILTH